MKRPSWSLLASFLALLGCTGSVAPSSGGPMGPPEMTGTAGTSATPPTGGAGAAMSTGGTGGTTPTGGTGGTTSTAGTVGTTPTGGTSGMPPTSGTAGSTSTGGNPGTGGAAMMPPGCTGEATGWLPKGATQLANLCARGYVDPISKAFCGSTPPTITSMDDVLKVLGLSFGPGPYPRAGTSGINGNPAFIMTAQSTAISMRKVSQINPRVIVFTVPLSRGPVTGALKPNPSYVAMGFTRGDQHVELLAKDPANGSLRFFLLKYEQACNTAPGGCTPGDLFTGASEKNFVSWSLYDDQDLKDTTLDCMQCHQPDGPGTPRLLRMQELQRPWQHWMYNDSLGILQLRADFHAAHNSTESYGGIPAAAFDNGDVQQFEAFIENNGFKAQPNEFAGAAIAAELMAGSSSATWQALYAGSENGRFIPVPYFGPVATDPVKVQSLITQYTSVTAGTLPRNQLGDLGDVFSDATQRAMTHKPALGLSGQQLLVQVCQECHNSRLDQTISRASFNIEKLAQLPRAEKDEAIRRINTPKNACDHMPPDRFRELSAAEIALVQAELQK
jgi:hypothetical protein